MSNHLPCLYPRLYIFGGNDIRIGTMNNLWCFDLSQIGDVKELHKYKNQNNDYPMAWQELKMRGQIPGGITHHQTVVAGKNMYLIGGVMTGRNEYNQNQMFRLDLQTLNWDSVMTRADDKARDMPN